MLQDLRFALHLIVKDRWYSAVAIVALSLGIGVNATVFTLVNAVLIRGLPYKDSAQLYVIGPQRKDNPRAGGMSLPDLRDWQEARSFSGIAASTGEPGNLSGDGSAPVQVSSSRITANAF